MEESSQLDKAVRDAMGLRAKLRRRRGTIVWISMAICALLVSGLSYRILRPDQHSLQVPAGITFPVYYPARFPQGYLLQSQGPIADTSTVSYTLVNNTKKRTITITLQAMPTGFDAAKLIGSNPIPTTITPEGNLYNLSIGDTTKYMLVAEETLIFITSPQKVSTSEVTTVVNSLEQLQ